MSISLIVKRKVSSHFTIVPNDVISDSNLSWKSLGLLVKLLSLPPGYKYLTVESLSKKNGTGVAATRSGLQELENSGYLFIQRKHDSRGRFAETVWHISDVPSETAGATPFCDNPNMDNPQTEQPSTANGKLINTNKTIKTKDRNTTTSVVPAQLPHERPLRLDALVSTETRAQIFKALEQVAAIDQQRMLDELSAAIRAGVIKTTAIRWFHGIIKRYRDGTYIFKPQVPAQYSATTSPEPQPLTRKDGPSTVKTEERSSVGMEHLRKLKKNRRSSNLLPEHG